MKIIFVVAIVFFLVSCAGNPQVVFFGEDLSPTSFFRLGEITLKNRSSAMEDELRSLQIGAASLAEIKLREDGNPNSDSDFVVNLLYADSVFIKGFRQIHSTSLILTILDSNDDSVAKVYYTKEGDQSFDSMKTLWNVTRLVWRKLAKEL